MSPSLDLRVPLPPSTNIGICTKTNASLGSVCHRLRPRLTASIEDGKDDCNDEGLDIVVVEGDSRCTRNCDLLEVDTSSALSLRDLTTGRFTETGKDAEGGGGAHGAFPTQRRHSKASPRARSQRPISLGGSPASFAHARFE